MASSRPDRSRLLLGFDVEPGSPPIASAALRRKLASLGLVIEGAGAKPAGRVQHTWRHLWVRDAKQRAISSGRIAELPHALGPTLSWVAPVQPDPESVRGELGAFLPDVLLVAAKPATDRDHIARTLSRCGLREQPEKSRYLGRWRYFVVETPRWKTAEQLAMELRQKEGDLVDDLRLEFLARASALLFDPSDPSYSLQWALPVIGAPAAWDIARGTGVIVAVIDSGCDLAHPELRFSSPGINLDTASGDGSPVGPTEWEKAHGTEVAGIIGAGLDDVGIAGLAGDCQILPLASTTYTLAAFAMGVRYAVDHGARVINMSFSIPEVGFVGGPAQEAIEDAVRAGVVLCGSSGNYDRSPIVLPARHPDVIASGASNHADARWRVPTMGLGSHFGDAVFLGRAVGVGVVAPGEDIYTTDISGPGGATPGASPFGDYQYFNATSASAPFVSATAALLLSRYPTLDALAVRRIIERTAEKTGGYTYADIEGYPNGTRHPEMGYGRLNAFRALDLGDVMIADWTGDDGVEPSTPLGGDFWTTSDIVVRPSDDGVFDPTDPAAASVLVRGRDHTIYVRVRNVGPADARNVHVEARVTPWVGLEFVYPTDWTNDDVLHLRPTAVEVDFPLVAAGGSAIARFTLTAAQVDAAAGWGPMGWHPCVLAVTTADNDYAFASAATGAALQMPRNNLAQRNLSVISATAGRLLRYPFVIGHPLDRERTFELVIDAGRVSGEGRVELVLDDPGARAAFPILQRAQGFSSGRPRAVKIAGGALVPNRGGASIVLTQPRAVVQLSVPQAGRQALALNIKLPRQAKPGERFPFSLTQRSARRGVVGGATLVAVVART